MKFVFTEKHLKLVTTSFSYFSVNATRANALIITFYMWEDFRDFRISVCHTIRIGYIIVGVVSFRNRGAFVC